MARWRACRSTVRRPPPHTRAATSMRKRREQRPRPARAVFVNYYGTLLAKELQLRGHTLLHGPHEGLVLEHAACAHAVRALDGSMGTDRATSARRQTPASPVGLRIAA